MPILKERIWGGQTLLSKYGRKLPSDSIGESWDVACHQNGISQVANGFLKGKSLKDIMREYGQDLMGSLFRDENNTKFPLLIKLLDALDVLSVQVHPDDEYAFTHENGELGKTEMWYIVDAKPGARLVYGIKSGTSPEDFAMAIKEASLEDYLYYIQVEPGDVLYIPSGMVHAIGEGIMICEIQQNSDTTYRVYDWNRLGDDGKPRDLHVEKALDVIDFKNKYPQKKLTGLSIKENGGTRTYYTACKYFAMEKLDVCGSINEKTDGEKFFILTVVEGNGEIVYGGKCEKFNPGDSLMIPAAMGEYKIEGKSTIIKSYVPNRHKDIIEPLTEKGYSKEQLSVIAGLFE